MTKKSMNKSESKSEIEPLKATTTTTTAKRKSSEYWKRENDYFNKCLAKTRAYEAEKEKQDIQEFRKRCESLDYCFCPSERQLFDYYLRSKNSEKEIAYCHIEEVDVYAKPSSGPQRWHVFETLTENYLRNPGKVGYFFTRSRPNEIQSGTGVKGHWIFGKMEDVLNEGEKVGVKQVIEYCEGDHSTGYKIIECQLHPAPVDHKAWFVCKLCDSRELSNCAESCLIACNLLQQQCNSVQRSQNILW